MEDINLSPVKRERRKKAEKKLKQELLKKSLPIFTINEIRRHKFPYHEALLADLQEANHNFAMLFLTNLIENQEHFIKKYDLELPRTKLIDSKLLLDELYNNFILIDTARKNNNNMEQYEVFLQLGIKYGFDDPDWKWLGEQFLLELCNIYIDKEKEALSYYLLGKFLFQTCHDIITSKMYLEKTREMSLEYEWRLPVNLRKDKCQTIFCASCYLLHKVLLEEAKLEKNHVVAIEICTLSKKRATEACDHIGEYDALMLRGTKELESNNAVKAIISFGKALNIALRENYFEGVCKARLKTTFALLIYGNKTKVLMELKILREFADKNNLPYYKAEALAHLGEFYLRRNQPNIATPFLTAAFYLFDSENDKERREELRCLVAISIGEELWGPFLDKLLDAATPNQNCMKLLCWMDGKDPFWDGSSGFNLEFDESLKITEEGEELKNNNEEEETNKAI